VYEEYNNSKIIGVKKTNWRKSATQVPRFRQYRSKIEMKEANNKANKTPLFYGIGFAYQIMVQSFYNFCTAQLTKINEAQKCLNQKKS